MNEAETCNGQHRFYVAEVIGVESEGKVYLLTLCTSCGAAFCKEFQVSKTPGKIRLLLEEHK